MKQINITIYGILFLLFLSACSKDYPCSKMEEHFMEYNYRPEIIKKSKIKSRTKIDASRGGQEIIVVYAKGKALPVNKVRAIDYFNEAGYLILSVAPKYKWQKADTTGFSKLTLLDQFCAPKEVETNEPSGQVDSTIFSYDNENRLIRKELKKQTLFGISYAQSIETYEYDDRNNLVKICWSSENSPTTCMTTLFKYDESGRIISQINEMPEEYLPPGDLKQIEIKYTYYSDGKLKSKGDENYIYENDRLKEEYSAVKNTKTDIVKYQYDKEGNLIGKKEIREACSSSDPRTGKYTVERYDSSKLNRTYDQRQLITEWYYKYGRSKDKYILYKFQYK